MKCWRESGLDMSTHMSIHMAAHMSAHVLPQAEMDGDVLEAVVRPQNILVVLKIDPRIS